MNPLRVEQIAALTARLLGKPVRSCRPWARGMCNEAWLITTSGNEQFLVKLAQEGAEETELNDLLTEAKLLQALNHRHPTLPVPQIAFVSERPMLLGYPFLKGQWMKHAWAALSGEERHTVCTGLAQFHARLHATFSAAECRRLGLTIDQDAALEAELKEDLDRARSHHKLPQELLQFAATCAHTLKTTDRWIVHGFCHNDSHHENILVHNGRLAGVVDFGDADFGDIHREFVRYASDYPDHFETIVHHYELFSGHRLSRPRIIARSLLEVLDELVADYLESGKLDRLYAFKALWHAYG